MKMSLDIISWIWLKPGIPKETDIVGIILWISKGQYSNFSRKWNFHEWYCVKTKFSHCIMLFLEHVWLRPGTPNGTMNVWEGFMKLERPVFKLLRRKVLIGNNCCFVLTVIHLHSLKCRWQYFLLKPMDSFGMWWKSNEIIFLYWVIV